MKFEEIFMLKSKFEDILVFIKNKEILITTHDLVDIDGLVSCFNLKFFLNHYFKNQKISIFFSELTKSTKSFIKKINERFPELDLSYENDFIVSNVDVLLIVDTNTLDKIKLKNQSINATLEIPYIFIDHHYFKEEPDIQNNNIKPLNIIFEDISSTAEIILQLFENYNVPLNKPLRTLFIAAILTDSGFFKHGNNNTIQNVSKLLSQDLKFQDILILLEKEVELPAKIAKIKGMQRLKMIREGEYLIGITNVSSFGASVASMLIKVGFDVSIVISKEENHSRINTRAKKSVCEETGLNLAKILDQISEHYEGKGGGHNGAASLTLKVDTDIIINELIENIKKYL